MRIEGYIEAIAALDFDAALFARAYKTMHTIERYRRVLVRSFEAGRVGLADFNLQYDRLTASEEKLSRAMFAREKKIEAYIIPEIRACAMKAAA
jgi:hypothetical protein